MATLFWANLRHYPSQVDFGRPSFLLSTTRREMALDLQFFLSDRDSDLSRTSARDPLGLEVIWTTFGRSMIPHLSTVSEGATNFGVLLALLRVIESYLADAEEGSVSFDDLMITADSLQVYCALSRPNETDTNRLLGRQRASRHLEEGSVTVGPKNKLLTSQISLGIYGRYVKPLESMRLVDSTAVLTEPSRKVVESLPCYEELQTALRNAFDGVKRNGEFTLGKFDAPDAMRTLRHPETVARFAPILRDAMEIGAGSMSPSRSIYQVLERFDGTRVGAGEAEVILNELNDHQEVRRVRDLEWVLCRLDALFETLFEVAELKKFSDYPGVMKLHDELRQEGHTKLVPLMNERSLTDTGLRRLERLSEVVTAPSCTELGERLIVYHEEVMDSRKRSGWIGLGSNGRLLVVRSSGGHDEAVARWRRNYYVASLADMRSDFVRAGVA